METRTEKKRTKITILSLLALLLIMFIVGCTNESTQNSIVDEEEIATVLEEKGMEIETQRGEDDTWINASSDTVTLNYWVNEYDNHYIEQSRESSLRLAEDMDGEVNESNGFTEIIIDWRLVGQEFYSVHLYGENKRIHIRLCDLNELDEIKNLVLN